MEPAPPLPPPLPASASLGSKKAMLAWWGILPAFAFLAFHLTLGWPEAKVRATGEDYAVSYLLGGAIGGVLIALLIAWIVYRVSNRSQLAGTATFSVIMVLLCLSVAEQSRRHRLATQPGATHDFPYFGVSFTSPAGWMEAPPDGPDMLAKCVDTGPRGREVTAAVTVEIKKTQDTTADAARGLSKDWGGQVVDEHVTIDGETAWRIEAHPPQSDLQPVEGLVISHAGHLFLIMGGITPGSSCHDQLEFVRRSWKWIPIDSPTKHLEIQTEHLNAINGKILIGLPKAMETFETGHPDKMAGLHLYNYKRNANDFKAVITLVDLPGGTDLNAAQERIGDGIVQRFNLNERFVWRPIKGLQPGSVTQLVRGPESDGVNWLMWALVKLNENQIALINISVYTADPDEQANYADAAQKIAETITLAPSHKKH
jgi:hypothetical protein